MKYFPDRIILNIVLVLGLLLFAVAVFPVSVTLAAPPFPSPDIDGDGISNDLETTGWYNLTGGPYITDPLNPDDDNDGLTDGEEKLYGTDPLNDQDPGIYVRYENTFETRQYFSPRDDQERDDYGNWVRRYLPVLQGGDKYLMTEAMVVRRGTTFHIGGPVGANLTIQGTGLTTLTPASDTCQNSWAINVPATGTTGTYTATMSLNGSPIKSMPIYVIFEFPSDLSAEEIDAYIYDDDPANKRDEVSVWWRTPDWSYYYPGYNETTVPNCGLYPNSPCSNWQYHISQGYAQAFWTEQFTQKVFVKYAMPAIQGKTSPAAAVYSSGDNNDLIDTADREFRTVYVNTHNNWSDALRKVYSTTLQAYTMDGGACQDNANVFTTLLRSAGIAAKPFLQDYNKTAGHGESGQIGSVYEYDHAVMVWRNNHWQIARSYNGEERSDVAYPFYNGRVAPRELYNFYGDKGADLIVSSDYRWDWQNGNSGGGMVNTVWDDQAEGIPSGEFSFPNNNWDIQWWSHRPLEIQRSPYALILNYESWYGDAWAPSEWYTPTVSNPVGRVATQTYVLPAGVYTSSSSIENWPNNPVPVGCSPSSAGTPDCEGIGVSRLLAAKQADISRLTYVGKSAPLQRAALFNDNFSYEALDTDGNSQYDALLISAGLDITTPGTFRAEGVLLDGQGNQVGYAEWTGAGPQVMLQFEIANTLPPYTLERLRLYKADGSLLSSRHYKAYVVEDIGGPVEQGAMRLNRSLLTRAITATNVFNVAPIDTDSNGLYDQIEVRAGVATDTANDYRIEGLLVDESGTPIVWRVSDPQHLNVGNGQLTLTFDGRAINDFLRFAPTVGHTFKLVGVKIFTGNLSVATLEESVDIAATTPVYSGNQFEPASPVARTIFKDNIPNGNNWSSTSPWGLSNSVYFSSPYAWRANVSTAQSGNLTSVSLSLSDYVQPTLRFKTCYTMRSTADLGYLEVSPNGGSTWRRVVTYTNSTQSWTTKPLDLSAFGGKNTNFMLRFRVDAQSGSQWAVDDVDLSGWPAVTQVAFTRTPTGLVSAGASVVFTATYNSINTTLPITYTWNFGEGDVVTTNPVAVHTFSTGGDHLVTLTVQNPYDSQTITQTVGARVGVSGVDFSHNPAQPEVSTPVAFTAIATPSNVFTDTLVYSWDFGDGGVDVGENITHTYSTGGNYIVKVTADNGFGQAETTRQITVKEGLTEVHFTYDPALPVEDTTVTFSAGYTRPTASLPITYTWNFGDAGGQIVSASPILTHTFANPGIYTVVVSATNNYNVPVTYSYDVIIDGRPVSSAAFTHAQAEAGNPNKAIFMADYEPVDATQPVTYTWDFDGVIQTSAVQTVTYEFPVTGTYSVTLTVFNGYGVPASVTNQIIVPFDDDGDGLDNMFEQSISTDPNNPDSDGDNRTDAEEYNGYQYTVVISSTLHYDQIITTNPVQSDTDGDGIDDGREYDQGTNPLVADTDQDGLSDVTEDGNGATSPLNPDTDNDGLTDGAEVNTYHTDPLVADTDGDGLTDGVEVSMGTNPLVADTDGDGLNDGAENSIGTNPLVADTDGDGLNDRAENSIGTNPLEPDSDGDGIGDAVEVGADPSNPVNTDGDGAINALDEDSDGDGKPDSIEGAGDIDGDGIANYLDPNDTDGPSADADGDGLTNAQEATLHTNPNNADTDADGVPDGVEVGSDLTHPINTDGDNLINALDPDDDGDSVPTVLEDLNDNGNPADDQTDDDGIPNYLDDDDDGDGYLTIVEDENNDGDPTNDIGPNQIPYYLDPHAHPAEAPGLYYIFLPVVIRN